MTSSSASPPLVALRRQDGYDPAAVKASVASALAPLGGMGAFVSRGQRVVLKPNLVFGLPPEKAATTHPAVVRAVAELCLDQGARVALGDSPGVGTGRRAGKRAGLDEVALQLGLEWVEFTPMEVVDESRVFKRLTLARELLDADVVINLPKLKTHCQMILTMAVKNLFGAVVGFEKFQWHYRAGRDKPMFARMLAEVAAAVSPALHVVDAVVAMDGNGPTGGAPNPTGFLAAGTDPFALDAVLCDVVGVPRNDLWTLQAARAMGRTNWESVRVDGPDAASLRPARWTLPETIEIGMVAHGLIRRFPGVGRWLRRQFAALPVPAPDRCTRCGLCAEICPAKAMRKTDAGIVVDDRVCIRCYCCHEFCPLHAMDLRKGWLQRLLGGRSTPPSCQPKENA